MSTTGTGFATIVYPPVKDSESIYPFPECVKGWEPTRFFPLQLRRHRKDEYIYHPFLSKGGFISFDDLEEAQAFLRARGYELVYFAEFRIPEGSEDEPAEQVTAAAATEIDEDDAVTGGPYYGDASHYDSAVSELDQ